MTTPRDDIAGLSERLRDCNTCGAYVQPTHWHSPDYDKDRELLNEAATALDALSAESKHMADTIIKLNEYLTDASTRATRAEQERDKLQGMLLLCGELGGIGKYETPVIYLRRLIDGLIDAGRERDEAYERAAKEAESRYSDMAYPALMRTAGNCIAAAIRSLAAGTEKEGK